MDKHDKVIIALEEEISRLRRLKDKNKFRYIDSEFALKRLAEKVYNVCRE